MLRKLRIGPRLIVLIAVQTLVALAVGSAGLLGLGFAANSTEDLSRNVQEGTRLSYLAETLRSDVLDGVYGVNLGVLTWSEGRQRLTSARERLDEDWQQFRSGLSADEAEFVDDVLTPGFNTAREALDELAPGRHQDHSSRKSTDGDDRPAHPGPPVLARREITRKPMS